MSIRLHRRFTSKHHTGGALRHLATKVGEMSGLAACLSNPLRLAVSVVLAETANATSFPMIGTSEIVLWS
jgi:hypothetical protein